MKKFIVPEENIDKMAIEEAIRKNAWLVIPEDIDVKCILTLGKDMGFEDQLKVKNWNDICYEELQDYENMVFLYADKIIEEYYHHIYETYIDEYNGCESSMFLIGD